MSSEYGKMLKISVFGQSHGKAVGVNIDGLPAGEEIDEEKLCAFMQRRAPGKNAVSTERKEEDAPIFLSGIVNGRTCGSPICAIIENKDVRPADYEGFAVTPRPGHADYTAVVKYGKGADVRGGGHFSGRLTAPICIAGGLAKQILERRGIYIGAHLASVGNEKDDAFPIYPTKELFEEIENKPLPVINGESGERMTEAIKSAAAQLDSVGGTVECAVIGVKAGVGSPMFDGLENRIAAAVFGIPAVKGIEFGAGFESSKMFGSENNDAFEIKDGKVATKTNNCGGILGGISNGMPIVFRVAFKPTPSIGKEQKTVDLETVTDTVITVKGRHDPCVAVRAVPAVEAIAAIVMLDILLEENDGIIRNQEEN
ncbi:MAG: chorismate synthase [Clostridia bacterium]|nr:chorismate synthase [Clostridia bacterium]